MTTLIGTTDHPVPEWLTLELAANHRGIEVRWIPYAEHGRRKVFVIPVTGDAFYRMPVPRLGGVVMYRRYIAPGSSLRWQMHPQTYMPEAEFVTDGRFVVFQTHRSSGELVKLFDVVNDDGSLHPLDRRVLDAIQLRDGKFGAQEKAIKDVEETVPALLDELATDALEDVMMPMLSKAFHDVSKHCKGGANDPEGRHPEADDFALGFHNAETVN